MLCPHCTLALTHAQTISHTQAHAYSKHTHTHSEPRANSATTRQLKHEHFLRFAYAPARKPIGRMFLSLCPPVRRSACPSLSACRGSASALCFIIRFCHNIELAPVYFELPSTLLLPLNRSYHSGLTPVANGITATWPPHHTAADTSEGATCDELQNIHSPSSNAFSARACDFGLSFPSCSSGCVCRSRWLCALSTSQCA